MVNPHDLQFLIGELIVAVPVTMGCIVFATVTYVLNALNKDEENDTDCT